MPHHSPSAARRFRRDENGATAIEYALLAAIIAIAIIGAIGSVGDTLGDNWDQINGDITEAVDDARGGGGGGEGGD